MSSVRLEDGEVADPSNACVAMVMNNGFVKGHTLIYDHLHRRHQTSEGLEDYPQAVLLAHETFTHGIEGSSEAKVEVVYGAKVQKRLLRRPDARYAILPLWGDCKGILLFLAYESNYENANIRYNFRRAILFAAHPQRMFYTPRGAPEAIQQDRIVAAAIRMAGEDTPIIEDYHQNRRFNTFTSGTSFLADAILCSPPSTISDRRSQDLKCIAELSAKGSVESADWYGLFNPKPHSYQTMLQLLPKALQSFESSAEEWNHPSEFPEPVLQWFKGQRHILFHDSSGLDSTDVLSVCHRLCPSSICDEHESPSLREMLYGIIKAQHDFPPPPDRHLRNHQHLWYAQYGLQDIETCCAVCGLIFRKDNWPKWCVNRPGVYCARYLSCVSHQCERKCRKMRPTDAAISWIKGEPRALRVENNEHAPWQRCIRPAEKNDDKAPAAVLSWCIKCQENTRLSGGRTVFEDNVPRWTLGKARPLYLERCPDCLSCKTRGSRFVPVDERIPSIYHQSLAIFTERFGNYDDEILAILLDQWPVPSKASRKKNCQMDG